ncbi:hypothetical protein [Streptomyces sp. bgisy029]|uniref:hypothetical protein n=1 Tax=Streptomyces sp. bgisy029 TaxID=3413771 RepID=UPI003D71BDB7
MHDRIQATAPPSRPPHEAPPSSPVLLPMPERLVPAYDNHGTYWGVTPASVILADIAEAYADGKSVNEWNVVDRAGYPIRIVRIPDLEFLDDILVIPGTTTGVAVAA